MTLYPILSKLYPEGSYGGQCGTFAHRLIDFPIIGNTLSSKKSVLQASGIPNPDVLKVGDVLITNESPIFGHVAVINDIKDGQLQLTESNYYLNGRIHHTRKISGFSKSILGVFRGAYLFPLPEVMYPIELKVSILMNTQSHWKTLIDHLHNLENWFYQASGGRIQITAIPVYTNVHDWETEFTGPVIGGTNMEIIKESWFDQFILPLALPDSHITIFNMNRSDWKGSVFDHPESTELGYAYEKVDMSFPGKIMCVWDEYDDYPPYYPAPLSAAAKLWAHEICHLLYGLAGGSNIVPGGDYTHRRWFNENNPSSCFDDLDYKKLNLKK